MIGYLQGTIKSTRRGVCLVVVAGAGYSVSLTSRLLSTLQPGQDIEIFTSQVVREDSVRLFGFTTEEEKELFERLLTISGIGPKLALALLSSHDPASLQQAVSAGDLLSLQSVPGVGKRSAERLLVELKGQLPATTGEATTSTPLQQALAGLGYTRLEISSLDGKVGADLPIEQQLRQALALLNSR